MLGEGGDVEDKGVFGWLLLLFCGSVFVPLGEDVLGLSLV